MMMRSIAFLSFMVILCGCTVKSSITYGPGGNDPEPEAKTETPAEKTPVASNPLAGKWVMDPAFIKSHKEADKDGFLTGMATTFWFEFKDDKTFRGAEAEGTYVYAEGVVNLITTKMGGKALEQDGKPAGVSMPGELSKDFKKLTLHPQMADQLPEALQTGIPMVKG